MTEPTRSPIKDKPLRLVQAWIEIHQDDLAAAWQMAVNDFRPGKIAPLQ